MPNQTENLAGGRGECAYCHWEVNNVSFHEAHECMYRPYLSGDDQMKDDSMTPEDVKTPPPLTPKDSLSVEVEEGIRKRHDHDAMNHHHNPFGQRSVSVDDVSRLLSIVEELRKEREDDIEWHSLSARHEDLKAELATAQAQLRRKDEALERIESDCMLSKEIREIARAALADGKEGGR